MSEHDDVPVPDRPSTAVADRLRRAALAHVERYASSEEGLRRVLERRLQRWMHGPDGIGPLEPAEATRFVVAAVDHCRKLGLLNDRAFAESKTASGRRKGHSTRKIAATLAAKGIDRDLAAAVLHADETDAFTAALIFARRMRLGPFRTRTPSDPVAADRRDLAALCRNGHGYAVARRALEMTRDEAEAALDEPASEA